MRIKLTRVRAEDGTTRDIRSITTYSTETVLGRPIQPGEEVVDTAQAGTVDWEECLKGTAKTETLEKLDASFDELREARTVIDEGKFVDIAHKLL